MGSTGESSSRQVTAALPRALLAYVRRAVGEAAVGEVLLDAGLDPQDPRLSTNDQWVSGREAVAIADAAAALCGDAQVGRRTGEEHFRAHTDAGIVDFLRAESDPAAAIALSADYSNRMGAGRRCYHVRETGPRQMVVEYTHSDHPVDQHWFWCQIAAGYWAQIPSLFGAVGTVVEPRCAARGDDRCELVVCWDLDTHLDDDSQVETEKRAERVIGRFEDLQSMAAEMATADDVPTVLERIVQRVSLAIMAPRFVLTVRRHENAAREVFAVGLTESEAHQASDALWAGREHPELGVPLVVPVASDRESHGYLAAFLAHGATVNQVDQRLLGAYAGHATAALERVVAIEAARRDHRATATLLDLAHDLASARSIPEIADRVTAAVPEVVGCELAGVWLLDADGDCCRLESVTDTWGRRGSVVFPATDLAELARSGEHAQPFAIDRSTATERTAQLLTEWGVDRTFLAPIAHRGELQGLLAAAAPATDLDQDLILKYLSAIANHASTAIGSTTLLAQVRHQALHDALTGLPNRPQIEQRVQDELWHAARTSRSVALAFVDLDRFKKVNDTLGHAAGDELIRMAATRLEESVRGGDVVARLGGDEFLVMVPLSSGPDDAVVVAEKILGALRQPFSINGESLFISASVGIACYPDHGTDYSMLLAHADAAMYEAKSRGRNTHAIHDQDLTVEARRRLKLENDLHRAVARNQLLLRYQPQVDLVTGGIVGVEALVRWAHPTMGELEPAQFLAIAEESGLIVDIDRWVRREAFSQAKRWSTAGTPVRVAVNLSTRDLHNPLIAEEIGGLLTELDLDPHLVELEVTDRVVMAEGQLPEWLSDLIALGANLAIDDFGTGNSVLSRLQRFPMDTMKIDRSFIQSLDDVTADPRLVRALISMAHALDMQVISEGVETVTQADLLRELGSDLVQGFLFHRPMPADQVTGLLAPAVPAPL